MNNNVLQEARQDSLKNLDDNSLSTLGMRCQDLRDVNSQIKDLEEQLKDLKESERKLSEEIIPAILHEKNLSSVVLKDGTNVSRPPNISSARLSCLLESNDLGRSSKPTLPSICRT